MPAMWCRATDWKGRTCAAVSRSASSRHIVSRRVIVDRRVVILQVQDGGNEVLHWRAREVPPTLCSKLCVQPSPSVLPCPRRKRLTMASPSPRHPLPPVPPAAPLISQAIRLLYLHCESSGHQRNARLVFRPRLPLLAGAHAFPRGLSGTPWHGGCVHFGAPGLAKSCGLNRLMEELWLPGP